MARYIGPKNRLSRRENQDLFGKGLKLRRVTVPPGQHGPKGTRRQSDYGQQLRQKQKTKRIYGIMETQFRRYFEKASRFRGSTGEKLLQLLELRLDNVVYRLGLVPTRTMARQLVSHGHVKVDGQVVRVPSYQAKSGEVITLSAKAVNIPAVKNQMDNFAGVIPGWLQREGTVGKIVSEPARADVDGSIDEQLIVEFYSR